MRSNLTSYGQTPLDTPHVPSHGEYQAGEFKEQNPEGTVIELKNLIESLIRAPLCSPATMPTTISRSSAGSILIMRRC